GGIIFAWKKKDFYTTNSRLRSKDMNSTSNQALNSNDKSNSTVSLETIIAIGLFGWLALSMTLMGLGIW
ncbi:MAG TPA: hypothetical protein VLC51_09135, partial [Nitrospira sp.]|nr:hypothetical protein [Nitrospira sp.]